MIHATFNIFLSESFLEGIIQWTNATIQEESGLLRAWDLRRFIAAMYAPLATFFLIQAEPGDHHNEHFYFDFLNLRQTHVCCQGRPTQCESLCPPFSHVSHATVFIFRLNYM